MAGQSAGSADQIAAASVGPLSILALPQGTQREKCVQGGLPRTPTATQASEGQKWELR